MKRPARIDCERGVSSFQRSSYREKLVTPTAMRRLGAIFIGLAIIAVIVVFCGLLGYIPKFGAPNSLVIAALLFSIVGRRLYRRGSASR